MSLCLSPRLIILGGGAINSSQLYPKIREPLKELVNGCTMPPLDLDKYIGPPERLVSTA